ncbi:MAG: helix-turn-helix transcriptional regulator, partial [Bdellovibrionales bacterium]|nr:helix-turn-helix transcriptional regulator [Bdellovibrionales bacterium]
MSKPIDMLEPDGMVGKRIQEHRRSQGLTQEDLARLADVPYATLTKVESGAIRNPSLHLMAKV